MINGFKTPIAEASAHRLGISWIDAVLRGGINCMTVYLRHSEGLSEANQGLLEEAAVALGTLKAPWIAAGDWNMSPQVLASSNWLQMVNGVVFATTLTTCNDNTYDGMRKPSIAKTYISYQGSRTCLFTRK